MATIVAIIGFETGDTSQITSLTGTSSIQSTTKRTGTYALRCNPTTTGTGFATLAGWLVIRFYFYAAALPAATENIMFAGTPGGASTVILRLASNGTLSAITSGGTFSTAAGAIAATTWYRIEVAIDQPGVKASASLNGVSFCTAQTATYNGAQLLLGKYIDLNGSSVDFFYDDILTSNTLADYLLGAGQSIARQPGAGLGTPTYNSWTKSTGTDAGALWDNTPFTTADFCSAASSVAQTSFVSPFSTGTNAIGASDTINAAQVGLIAKTSATSSSGNTLTIRRRVNGADTDKALTTVTTSDAFFSETTLWTDTLTHLDGMQAGAVVTAGTRTRTVEDVWIFVDYTPPSSSIKTIDGLARASVKTVDALALASMKTWNGLA